MDRPMAVPMRARYAGVESHPVLCGDPFIYQPSPAATDSSVNRADQRLRPPTPAERKRLVAAIAELTELRFVQIDIELDDEDLKTLSSLGKLEFLGFNANHLTSAGMANLQKVPKIYRLEIHLGNRASVAPEAVTALARHPALELLNINGPLHPEDVARLKAAIPRVDVEVHVTSD